eukprot:3127042-Rhodomonas_salina.1
MAVVVVVDYEKSFDIILSKRCPVLRLASVVPEHRVQFSKRARPLPPGPEAPAALHLSYAVPGTHVSYAVICLQPCFVLTLGGVLPADGRRRGCGASACQEPHEP